jgi:hypothetical protein
MDAAPQRKPAPVPPLLLRHTVPAAAAADPLPGRPASKRPAGAGACVRGLPRAAERGGGRRPLPLACGSQAAATAAAWAAVAARGKRQRSRCRLLRCRCPFALDIFISPRHSVSEGGRVTAGQSLRQQRGGGASVGGAASCGGTLRFLAGATALALRLLLALLRGQGPHHRRGLAFLI